MVCRSTRSRVSACGRSQLTKIAVQMFGADGPNGMGDLELLERARLELETMSGQPCGPWILLREFERPRSSMRVLATEHPRGRSIAYYKLTRLPGSSSPKQVERARETLRREFDLRADARRVLNDAGFHFDYVLAVDVEDLAGIRLAVQGEPLRKPRLRRTSSCWPLRRMGELIALIEAVGGQRDSGFAGPDTAEPGQWIDRIVAACATRSSTQLARS